jgi:hypothetical protein
MPDVTVSNSDAVFDPKKIELKNTRGTIGKSDFAVSGAVSNYIGYVFGKNEVIKGNVDFNSTLLDLNEFMTETEVPVTPTDTASFGVIPIPDNIDFILRSSIKTVKMMDYTMTDLNGDIIAKDGVANMNNVKFNMLGGAFVVNGSYNAKDLQHPKYDFALKIDGMSIQQAATSFSIVKTYVPVAGLVKGNFSTDFKVNGELGQDLMPKMTTVNGGGLVKIAEAALTQSKLVSGVTSLTKLNDTDQVSLKDVLMSASISDGRLSVKPFDVKFGSYVTTVSGSTGVDGTIDYSLKMMVPAGQLGAQFSSFVNQYAGTNNSTTEIPLTIGVGGTYNNPKTTLMAQEQKQQAKEAVKEAVTQKAEEKSQEVIKQAVEGTSPKDIVNNILKPKKDSTQTPQDSAKTNTQQETQKLLQNKLNGLLKKKKN